MNSHIRTGYITSDHLETPEIYEAADCFSIHYNAIDRNLVSKIHRMGKAVYSWPVNDYNGVKQCVEAGVDGIIGNNPQFIRKVLVEG